MIAAWMLFLLFVAVLLALDLGVFHRSPHVVGFREALAWSAIWVVCGLAFAGVVFLVYEHDIWGLGAAVDPVDGVVNDGGSAVGKYLTGYLIEKSLSVDNIFVVSMIFTALAVSPLYQHRVLFWGVIGAVVMRGAMIVVGARLVAQFHWLLQVFAVLLIATAIKMLVAREEPWDPRRSRLLGWIRRVVPLADEHHGSRFLVRMPTKAGVAWALTPIAVALLLVEAADLVFAIDSIPAIFAITGDPFLVFTSNVFAMLGLRSLYFALAGLVHRFRYLKPALAAVLLVVGCKMLAAEWLHGWLGPRFNLVLLAAVAGILMAGVVASLAAERRGRPAREETAVGMP